MRTVEPPARLPSEEVVINAPMSYAGSAQCIVRVRCHADGGPSLVAATLLAILLVRIFWALVPCALTK